MMYNIDPNKDFAKQARLAQSNRVKTSIIYLLQECSDKLNLQDARIVFALSKVQEIERLLPEIHYFHHGLQAAMRRQDSTDARAYFFKLIDVICSECPANEWISISSIGDAEWEGFARAEAIRLAKEDLGKLAEIEPVSESELSFAKDIVSSALYTIARYDPDMFDEIHEHVRIIKLFCGKVTMGLTDVRILGAMLIRLPRQKVNPLLYFLEHIIHEASHIHLNCLMTIDPLILNLPEERYTSPLREDPRPMLGVFHATYVSARISRAFMKLYNKTKDREILHPLAETLDETIRGIFEIKKNGKLTIAGQQLVKSMDELIKLAETLSEWKQYKFTESRSHRFGAGETKVSELQKMVA